MRTVLQSLNFPYALYKQIIILKGIQTDEKCTVMPNQIFLLFYIQKNRLTRIQIQCQTYQKSNKNSLQKRTLQNNTSKFDILLCSYSLKNT